MAHSRRAKVKDPAKAFISTWRTSTVYTGSTADNQIKLPLEVAGTYKFTVQWGDGTSNLITTWNQAETTHTYATPGDYTVTITGFIKGWDFGGGGLAAPTTGDMRKLLTITQWGCLRFVTKITSSQFWGPFYGCTNLNLTAVQDMPNFKGTTSILGLLRNSTAITTINNINKWDVSKITFFRNALRELINFNDNVGNWNMSNATSVANLFFGSNTVAPFGSFTNGGSDSIKNWDVSKVQDASALFCNQRFFNHDIGSWNVSSMTNMSFMFGGAAGVYHTFDNGGSDSISNWNTSNVTNMSSMFQCNLAFNRNISNWNTSNVTNMGWMFTSDTGAGIFNQPIGNWNTSKVTAMNSMFYNQRSFDQNIGAWDVSKVTTFSGMFVAYGGSTASTITGVFNNGGSDSIKNWNTSSATNMTTMFYNQPNFNQEIGLWNVSNVTTMSNMLAIIAGQNSPTIYGAFNNAGSDSIKNWNTSKVTNMQGLFYVQPSFNQEIGTWDVSKVTDFSIMFSCYAADPAAHPGTFNNGGSNSISTWNTGSALTMRGMFFSQYAFNKTINGWDTSKVTNMNRMMASTPGYDLPLNNLNVSLVTDFGNFMENRTFNDYSAANYDALLIGWASRPVKPNISINFNTIKRTAASTAARLVLTSAPNNWTIVDGGI